MVTRSSRLCLAAWLVLASSPLVSWAGVPVCPWTSRPSLPPLAVVFVHDRSDREATAQAGAVAAALRLHPGPTPDPATPAGGICSGLPGTPFHQPVGSRAAGVDSVNAAVARFQEAFRLLTGRPLPAQPRGGPRGAVLLVSDGSRSTRELETSARALLARGFPTLVAALPRLAEPARLDPIAEAGGSGLAISASSVEQLVPAIRAKIESELLQHLRGDHTTGGAGAASLAGGTGSQVIGIQPSFVYPGYEGRLRAIDFSRPCSEGCPSGQTCEAGSGYCQLWEAASLLRARIQCRGAGSPDCRASAGRRELYTGRPELAEGRPLRLAVPEGGGWKPCVAPDECGPGHPGVRAAWRPAGSISDESLRGLIRWLLARPLGALIGAVPATVTRPPDLPFSDHASFARHHALREQLVYVGSSEGLLHAFLARSGEELFGYLPAPAFAGIYQLYQQGGQSADPAQLIALLDGSPRVEDHRSGDQQWRTELHLRVGASSVVLDISDPRSCDALITCRRPRQPVHRFRLLASSSWPGPARDRGLPALYWGEAGYRLQSSAGSSRIGHPDLTGDVVAVSGPDGILIATYRSSREGKVLRWAAGSGAETALVEAGAARPFWFGPAAIRRTDGVVSLLALSGQPGAVDPASFEEVSTIYLRSELEGKLLSEDTLDKPVNEICTPAPSYRVPAGVCPSGAPSRRARPVTDPILTLDTSGSLELLALYHEASAGAGPGDSWFLRLRSQGRQQSLLEAIKYRGTRLTGMTLLGGGREIVFSRTGSGELAAGLFKRRPDQPLGRGLTAGTPVIESWRELE